MGKKHAGRAGVFRADGGWPFWLTTFYLDIGPLEIAFPLDKVRPDDPNRGCDDRGGTNRQTHGVFLISISGSSQR
jgi:hypothetical protein